MVETSKTYTIEQVENLDEKIALINTDIQNMQDYIDHNAYDRASVRETEQDIQQYERQLRQLTQQRAEIIRGLRATGKLDNLRAQKKMIEDKLYRVEDRMDSCQINIDSQAYRTHDIPSQSADDMVRLRAQQFDLMQQLTKMTAIIKKIENLH